MQRHNQYLTKIEQTHGHLTDQEIIELIKASHKERKIDYCMGLIGILRQRKTPLTKQLEQEFVFITEIYTKTERCLDYFKDNTDMEGWFVDRIDDNNVLSSKVIHRGEVLIRYDGQVDVEVFNLIAMIYETGLFSNWVPMCSESKDIKSVGIAAKVAYIKFNLPFISDREGYFYGQGIDRLTSTGSVVVYVEGITNNKAQQKRLGINIVKDEKCTDMDLKFMVCEVKMLKPKSYMFRVFAHLDTRVFFFPQFLMGFFSKKFGRYLINKLQVTAADLKGTQWEKRINESGDLFYPWMQAKMDFWKENYGKPIEAEKPPRPADSKPVKKLQQKQEIEEKKDGKQKEKELPEVPKPKTISIDDIDDDYPSVPVDTAKLSAVLKNAMEIAPTKAHE